MKVEISKDKVKFSEIEPGELFIWNNELLVRIKNVKDNDESSFNVFNLVTSELMVFFYGDEVKPFSGIAVISNPK